MYRGPTAAQVYTPANATSMEALEALMPPAQRGKISGRLNIHEVVAPGPCEDAASMALTALARLCERHNVPWSSIGRLEVRGAAAPLACLRDRSFH